MNRAQTLVIALLVLITSACGGGRNAEEPTSTSASALAAKGASTGRVLMVSLPAATSAVVGTPLQLVAQVKDKNGKTVSGIPLSWESGDQTVATVNASGLVMPLRVGSTAISASTGASSTSTVLSVSAPIDARSRFVGTNLSGIAYYSTQFPFADMMKSGMGWISRDDNGVIGTPFPTVTPDGYPASLNAGQHAISAVAWNGTHYPAGRYVVLWDGEGTISFPMSNVAIAEASRNRIAIDVTDTSGQLWVSIDATSSTNPVHNLRFLWPGTEVTHATQPFNPVFLNKIRPFSVLRFMDWGMTNGSSIVNWSDRPKVADVTYANAGVPLEVMIDLANALHADPWLCISHQATDDYVRQFATLLHSRLDPTLRPHIEYSNEVWNTGFSQTTWAVARSQALGLDTPWGTPSLFYAQRSVEIFRILQQIYGPDSGRLVRVLSGQAVWTQFLENALRYRDTAANADVIAIAPYFNAEQADKVENVDATLKLSSDNIVDQMLASIRGPVTSAVVAKYVTQDAATAPKYQGLLGFIAAHPIAP